MEKGTEVRLLLVGSGIEILQLRFQSSAINKVARMALLCIKQKTIIDDEVIISSSITKCYMRSNHVNNSREKLTASMSTIMILMDVNNYSDATKLTKSLYIVDPILDDRNIENLQKLYFNRIPNDRKQVLRW